VAPAPVGTVYPVGLALEKLAALNAMTLDEVSALIEWSKDNCGIASGDDLAVCRTKLQMWSMRE
jgi:hypothetical protein